ncbi:MAG: AAA family ATPase [Candidatus Thermoplasmatota archaeon]|nr:AAA family ATPase [Candidatus Thermoplasmatota archaeon]
MGTGSQDLYQRVKVEISRSIIGYEDIIEDFLICLSAGGHILLEGVPGIAKTTLAKTLSDVVGLTFKRIQFTQDLLPADITGHYFYNQKQQEFNFRKGPIFSNIVLADEINRAPTKTQSALLEAMEEKQVTVEGTTFKLEEPFLVIATINPVEHEGVYVLPEAQLDRFMVKSIMDYLSVSDELRLLALKNRDWRAQKHRPLGENIYQVFLRDSHSCRADTSILTYIRDVVHATRVNDKIVLGASPRAGEQILYASKAAAALAGRDYVIPDDVKRVARKMVPHRLTLSLDSELDGISPKSIVEDILSSVEVVRPQGA